MRQGETRVDQDAARLDQSRTQLRRDRETLAQSERESTQAARTPQQAAPAVNLDRAIQSPSRAEQALTGLLTASRPQVNSLGQAIGKFINVTA
ncbi:hypothetical protein ASF61_14135 [Duganella sp. Leaf126]|nr:hypothetical protein ASF61_14135 [Duganella sp. Leaf126]